MKSIIRYFILIFIFLFLVGCQEEPYLELTGPTQLTVNESVLFLANTNQNAIDLVWSSSNEEILAVDDGIVLGVSAGKATLKVALSDNSLYKELEITILSLDTLDVQTINSLASTIFTSIPDEVTDNLDLKTVEGSALITYESSKPSIINDDGKITRSENNEEVTITYTITLNETTRSFNKTVVVLKMVPITLSGDLQIAVSTETTIAASANGYDAFLFSSSNEAIFEVNEQGNIKAKQPGKAYLTVALAADPLSFVVTEISVFNPLDVIGTYLKDAIPSTIDQDVLFLEDHPDYQFSVTYETNSDYIDNEGKITKDAEDRYVTIAIMIALGEQTKTFYKSVVISCIDIETQLQNTKDWFSEVVSLTVNQEEGMLPSTDGVYNRPLTWVASDPGMIVNQSLYPSMTQKDVKLVVFFSIDNRKHQYEFSYTSQGVSEMDKLQALNRFMDGILPSVATNRINLPYEQEVVVTPSIVYPNTINRMRPGTGLIGQKMPGGVKYIVIHDTGMSGANDTAVGVKDYFHAQANSLTGRVASWHYTIDEKDCFQHVPDDEIAWHAGDGSHAYGTTYFNTDYQAWSIGGGNQNGIGIETCINQGGNYQLTLQRTAKLVASLLTKYHLGLDAIKQHNDFSGKNCPAVIRSSNGRWSEFLKMVEWHLMMMSFEEPYSVKVTISNDQAIGYDGNVNQQLINDETVSINFALTLGSAVLQYDYEVIAKGMTTNEKISSLYLYLYNQVIPRETNSSLVLPIQNTDYQATLTWSSSNPEIISDTGVYTKPSSSKLISLWVTMEIDGKTETKVFKIMVS